MRIRELRFNIQFEYIKEIRKYLYDLEEFIKRKNFCDTVNPVPLFPDDFEPQVERLSTTKTKDDKIVNIFISQTYISILVVYTALSETEKCFEKDLEYISNISKDIKEFFTNINPSFKINFERLILASSETILKNNITLVNKLLLQESIEEERRKKVTAIDDKHFKNIEISTVKIYKDEQNVNTMAIKNSEDKFIGWEYILVCEINNRLEYNNSKDDLAVNLELNLGFVSTEINNIIKDEAI